MPGGGKVGGLAEVLLEIGLNSFEANIV